MRGRHAGALRADDDPREGEAHAQTQLSGEGRIDRLAAGGPDKGATERRRRERRASGLVPTRGRDVDGGPEITVERRCIDIRPGAGGGGEPGGVDRRSGG
jgi:hypothetical protein